MCVCVCVCVCVRVCVCVCVCVCVRVYVCFQDVSVENAQSAVYRPNSNSSVAVSRAASSATSGSSNSGYGVAASDGQAVMDGYQPASGPERVISQVKGVLGGIGGSRPNSQNSAFLGGGGALSDAPSVGPAYGHGRGLFDEDQDKALSKREQDILEREKMLAQKENPAPMGTSEKRKNWPSQCYPLYYHSINDEVLERRTFSQ
jgi:hypothetical protein